MHSRSQLLILLAEIALSALAAILVTECNNRTMPNSVLFILQENWALFYLCLAAWHVHSTMKKFCTVHIVYTSKEPVCPRVELILKIIIILIIIFLGFTKSKPC